MGILNYTFADFQAVVALRRYNTIYSSLNATDQTACNALINRAYANFLNANDWGFLAPEAQLMFWTSIPTGSGATVASATALGVTTVTMTPNSSGIMFYPSMVGRQISIVGKGTANILTYSSPTVITIDTSYTCTGADFSLATTGDYALPLDFGYMIDDPTFPPPNRLKKMEARTPQYIQEKRTIQIMPMSDPIYYAVVPRYPIVGTSTGFDLMVFPTPNMQRLMNYRYAISPLAMSNSTDYPIGGSKFSNTIMQGVRAACEQDQNIINGPENALYQKLLADSIRMATRQRGANHGCSVDLSDGPDWTLPFMHNVELNYGSSPLGPSSTPI